LNNGTENSGIFLIGSGKAIKINYVFVTVQAEEVNRQPPRDLVVR